MDFLGKVMHVDLTSEKTWIEEVPREKWTKYLPSRGLNAQLLWELTDETTDPLGEHNVLIFGVGGLTGTLAPCSGRTTVTFKSPATGMYFKSNTGGHWGAMLKRAGIGTLIIRGKAKKPIYLYINDGQVSFLDATSFWGKDVRQTNELIRTELEDDSVQTVAIGPAGENKVLFAALLFSTYNAAGRGGGGAVMGSKNLKAIAVRGTGQVKIENHQEFYDLAVVARESIKNDSGYIGLGKFGTAGSVTPLNEAYMWPTKNFQKCYFPKADQISGIALVETKRLKRRTACYSCIIGCHRYTETESDKFKAFGGGPELETIDSFGPGMEVSDLDAIIKANELCKILGMDTISTGGVMQWAWECFEKGLLDEKDTGGLTLEWGDGETMVKVVEQIAHRQGLGNLLADGVKRAAAKVGQESERWAMESKGLEHSGVDTRMARGYALAFAVNPRGADHLHTETFAELGFSSEGRELIKQITNSDTFIEPTKLEKRAEIVRWHEDCFAVTDALGFCAFTTTALYGITPEIMACLWSVALGAKVSTEEIMEAGRRIMTLEKLYNVRCGASRQDDRLPWRIMNEDASDRPGTENMAVTQDKLDCMLNEYYTLHDWDLSTSWPRKGTLMKMGLAEQGEELARKNITLMD